MDEAVGATRSNIPEYSVSDLSGAIKRTLEGAFGRIRVRGEITELKAYPSGHVYLSLKDEGGKVRAVIWKSAAGRLGLKPENGVEVIATGKISAYGDRSEYQLVIDRLEYAGAGALLARIELLKQRLVAEGLFDATRKQPIPRLPDVVGVITSSSGAVLHDIMTTIARRFPRRILLWPVPVQGEGAAERIAADTTLIDFVSDRRAPTPTAAAEMAVPARLELLADLAQKTARLLGSLDRLSQSSRSRLAAAGSALPDLPGIVGNARLRLDDRGQRLALALPNLLSARGTALVRVERHIPDPRGLIAARRATLEVSGLRLLTGLRAAVQRHRDAASAVAPRLSVSGIRQRLREQSTRLEVLAARLDGASYERVLARGFVLVRDAAGHAVTRTTEVKPGARLKLVFGDGQVSVTAENRQGRLPL
jgi:exodeoxyribonuclease VII large subunit